MSVTATVVYPAEPDATFDMKYYLSTHMPLVQKSWAQYGLTDWRITELAAGPDGVKPYSVQAVLTFKDHEALQAAMGSPEAKDVFGDIPNFSNKQPVLFAGQVVGSM